MLKEPINRVGFSLVYQPEVESQPGISEPHSMNIIFLHGLRGHPRSTWEYSTSSTSEPRRDGQSQTISRLRTLAGIGSTPTSSNIPEVTDELGNASHSKFWPSELLTTKVPHSRIWSYGYMADAFSGFFKQNNQNSVLAHANDFKVKLERTLKDDALSQMEVEIDPNYQRLLRRLHAIVFCGTPHRGSGMAFWASTASNVLKLSTADVNSKLISDLQINSEMLGLIQDDFLKTLHRITLNSSSNFRVHSFLEGRAVTGINGLNSKVVDDFSAKLGWAGEVFETVDADHRQMVKEPGAKDISEVLSRLEEKERSTQITKNTEEPTSEYKEWHKFFTIDYVAIMRLVPERRENTCDWLPKTSSFALWLNGENSPVLWLHGYPGMGKSVLARYLVELLSPDSGGSTDEIGIPTKRFVAYYFCSYLTDESRNLCNLWSSILHQLIYQRRDLTDAIRHKHAILTPRMLQSSWSLFSIFQDIYSHMKHYEDDTAYVIIDAVDELHPQHWGEFCTNINDIFKALGEGETSPIKFIITSRKEPIFQMQMTRYGSIDLAHCGYIKNDIAEYLEATVHSYGKENNFDSQMISLILSEILSRADGIFLWVTLVWNFFISGVGKWTRFKFRQRIQTLRELPPGMANLYQRILSTVDQREQGDLKEILHWLAFSKEILTVTELSIAVGLRTRPSNRGDIDQALNMETFLKTSCPNLVKIWSDRVTLLHQSLKDFLTETKEIGTTEGTVPNSYYISDSEADFNIGLDCLCYITIEEFRKEGEHYHPLLLATHYYKNDWVFFHYAYRNWYLHASGQNERAEEIWEFFRKLIIWKFSKYELLFYDTSFMIFKLWELGLYNLYRPMAELGVDLNVRDRLDDHLIHAVVPEISNISFPSLEYVTTLGVDINGTTRYGETLLHRCVAEWQYQRTDPRDEEITGTLRVTWGEKEEASYVQTERNLYLLLRHFDADVNVVNIFGRSPLSFAIYEALHKPMEILLEFGQMDTIKGSTSLHVAAEEGVLSAVQILLKKGVAVHTKNQNGDTALHLAASRGHLKVLQALTARCKPFVLNAKNNQGWTILHKAVVCGNEALLRWTVTHPQVNLNIVDNHGRRASAFAAAYATEEMLDWFFQRDPSQFSHRDLFGNSLLHMAAKGGNIPNIKYLLKRHFQREEVWLESNCWGQTLADSAQSEKTELWLLSYGFLHSNTFLARQEMAIRLKLEQEQQLILSQAREHELQLIIVDEESERKRQLERPRVSDNLGKQYNTIYAID